ncbi:MAG: ABC transporter substrate-binding protein [Clostridia bacterium]|nr:ABC transporter substrate-binding protein [Clostridia bacterium]
MKKILKYLFTLSLVVMLSLTSFIGCGQPDKITVITPDGAPALSIAKMMSENQNFGEEVTYKVIDSTTITNYVPNNSDIAIIPLNAATKLAGDKFKIVAVNTHGNLYVLGKETITDMNTLIGKKVAVIQYANVPGLTFRAVLNGNNIPYAQIGEINDTIDETKVNLYGCDPTAVAQLLSSGSVDYALCAEPSVTILTKNLSAKGIKVCLNLQTAYHDTFNENYPQAVTIVKKTLIENNPKFVKKFIQGLKENDSFLVEDNIETILSAISSHIEEGLTPVLNGKLNATSMTNCNVKYVDAYSVKEQIKNYVEKIKLIDATKVNSITDDIFYKAD